MQTQELQIGQEFYFQGDWQTERGKWRVIGFDDEVSMIECEPVDNAFENGPTLFHKYVTVDVTE